MSSINPIYCVNCRKEIDGRVIECPYCGRAQRPVVREAAPQPAPRPAPNSQHPYISQNGVNASPQQTYPHAAPVYVAPPRSPSGLKIGLGVAGGIFLGCVGIPIVIILIIGGACVSAVSHVASGAGETGGGNGPTSRPVGAANDVQPDARSIPSAVGPPASSPPSVFPGWKGSVDTRTAQDRSASESPSASTSSSASSPRSGDDWASWQRAQQQFMNDVSSVPNVTDLLVETRHGLDDGDLKIVVASRFFYEPHQIRLQIAQALWKIWAANRSPNDLDKARITLVDRAGNKVGGSSWLAGSIVSVDD